MYESKIESEVSLSLVTLNGERFLKISNNNHLRPFFMNIVSASDHWMFISSNGGLTAGRKNSEYALFPYYSEDKITESVETTGSKTIFKIYRSGKTFLWEPFSIRQEGRYRITRNIYKGIYGNKIRFEEINHDLELQFAYQWSNSDIYGFIRQVDLSNYGTPCELRLIDGIQNILPAGVHSDLQNSTSNLVDAYKWNQLHQESGMGIYALSAIIVDRAEPSEALMSNIVWSTGLENSIYLLSSGQLDLFRNGIDIQSETDIKAEKGAFFLHSKLVLEKDESKSWLIAADVNKDQSDVLAIIDSIDKTSDLKKSIKKDIDKGTEQLIQYVSMADGIQHTSDILRDARHYSNVLFNIMRGGIIDDQYRLEKKDFLNYLEKANKKIHEEFCYELDDWDDVFSLDQLREFASSSTNPNLKRLCLEYLPLKFSRRHGDPSRPWNKFSINIRNEDDGSRILDYEGNWRDIFQNWEALVHSYPEFIRGMIAKFLNATSFDGYNPYRVTKDGFDWETIEADDPWSYIGYWGDHQIIYLLKFLEFIEKYYPGELLEKLNRNEYVYANVPYKIKKFEDIILNPKDTIEFDENEDKRLRQQREIIGADAALLYTSAGEIYHVNFLEKILATTLAKLSNFIPEGGIWMNTQRPEWNDANNALVGNGVSMVTLYYLKRFFTFLDQLLSDNEADTIDISSELFEFFQNINITLNKYKGLLSGKLTNMNRRAIVENLGQAGSNYRHQIYQKGFSAKKSTLKSSDVNMFIKIVLEYLDHSIAANKRPDYMYHAYNLLSIESDGGISISNLDEMLEGQVAILSSSSLSSIECLNVLDSMKQSRLFRTDQYSYLLYPNKNLKDFFKKNTLSPQSIQKSELLIAMINKQDYSIVKPDINGNYHFNGKFRNAIFLSKALDEIDGSTYRPLTKSEKKLILELYEDTFNHKAFTGRSGTFFGYEGLGSIYWHMVSKLLMAVQECCHNAMLNNEDPGIVGHLLDHYYEISEGIGVHKSPELYGAFPTDPYSHTPGGKGAQQPGMTGQVKEDILTRFGELGLFVSCGKINFNPCLLRKEEFLKKESTFSYIDINDKRDQFELSAGSLAFTYCQVPIIYKISGKTCLIVEYTSGKSVSLNTLVLDKKISSKIFKRTGEIAKITAGLPEEILK